MQFNGHEVPEEQLQDVVDYCEGLLLIDSAKAYGLISGGPQINAEVCVEFLAAAAERGYRPGPHAAERTVALINGGASG